MNKTEKAYGVLLEHMPKFDSLSELIDVSVAILGDMSNELNKLEKYNHIIRCTQASYCAMVLKLYNGGLLDIPLASESAQVEMLDNFNKLFEDEV